jgi:hypothetical protein
MRTAEIDSQMVIAIATRDADEEREGTLRKETSLLPISNRQRT